MVSVTPGITRTSEVTVYGLFATVQVVSVLMGPPTLVSVGAARTPADVVGGISTRSKAKSTRSKAKVMRNRKKALCVGNMEHLSFWLNRELWLYSTIFRR
jgi:hypothetical protein